MILGRKLSAYDTNVISTEQNVSNELRIWSQLNHANILPLIGFTMDLTYPTLVSKWVDDGSLRQSLNSLDRNEALAIVGSGFAYAHPSPKNTKNAKAIGVAKGVAYLHSNNIVHADIKSVSFQCFNVSLRTRK